MHYLVSVLDEVANPGPPSDMAATDVFNDWLRTNGHWVYANGLSDPTSAVVIDGRRAAPSFAAGPFVRTNEFVAGFWIIEAPDLEVAKTIAAKGSNACNRKVELRPFHTASDRK